MSEGIEQFVILGWCGEFDDHRYWVQSAPIGQSGMELTVEVLRTACGAAVDLVREDVVDSVKDKLAAAFREVDPLMAIRATHSWFEFPLGYEVWRIDPLTGVPQRLEESSIAFDERGEIG